MAKRKKKLAFVLGIRPDIIRAALIMNHIKKVGDIEVIFIWSGQHYDDNLKGIFFRELRMPKPDYDLGCRGTSDADTVGQIIKKLYDLLLKIKPDAIAFLGDTNTTTGCLAAALLNVPIIHVEGCWHSYDWRMPEEKYRTMIDHLSDVIYTYEEEYKLRGIAEGLNPRNIVVVRNPIVDILNKFYYRQKSRLDKKANAKFFKDRGIKKNKYYLLTWHRRENVHIKKSFEAILDLIKYVKEPVYFPASYRTQGVINRSRKKPPKNLIVTDPTGYEEILMLMTNSKSVITDSGTIVEETSVLNIPTIQMRKSTERPQVYDVGGCVKFDPDQLKRYPPKLVMKKLDKIRNKKWKHSLGDGKSSERIANDLIRRLRENDLRGHLPKHNHLPINRSFREDGIKID